MHRTRSIWAWVPGLFVLGPALLGCNADPEPGGLSFGAPVASGNGGGNFDGGGRDGGTGATEGSGSGGAEGQSEGDGTAGDAATGAALTADGGTSPGTGDGGGCIPGDLQACYSGPANTENVGECTAGSQTCSAQGTWDPCLGETLPGDESCNGLDDDCNGTPDDGNPDAGDACDTGLPGPCLDGVSVCQGGSVDCEPVTPPAVAETCGNLVDDDCNGTVDDTCTCDPLSPLPGCGPGLACQPQPDDSTACVGPTGTGTQYTACAGLVDCNPVFACIQTTVTNAWCMQWCFDSAQCSGIDVCTPLNPPVSAEGQEYGVCWDGFP